VKSVSAHVHDGHIVLDDPVDLPEGAAVEVWLPDHHDESGHDESADLERADLEAALAESAAEFERGEIEDARAFALRLVARA